MRTIGGPDGISIDELKKAGMSNQDIEYILEAASLYLSKISEPGKVVGAHDPASVITIAHHAFEAGIALGIAEGKKLTGVTKQFGFAPPH